MSTVPISPSLGAGRTRRGMSTLSFRVSKLASSVESAEEEIATLAPHARIRRAAVMSCESAGIGGSNDALGMVAPGVAPGVAAGVRLAEAAAVPNALQPLPMGDPSTVAAFSTDAHCEPFMAETEGAPSESVMALRSYSVDRC